MRVLRASTSCVTSFTILAVEQEGEPMKASVSTRRCLRRVFAPLVTSAPLLRGDMVVYHFARRTLPCREIRRKKDKPVSSRPAGRQSRTLARGGPTFD